MNFYAIRNWISIIKQKNYCNNEVFIYVKSDQFIPEIIPELNVRIEVIKNKESLKKYWNNPDIQKIKEKIHYFLNNGCFGYFAVYNKEIVASCWVCDLNNFHPRPYLNNPVFKGKNNYYFFNGNTQSNYRKKGIMSYIVTKILKDLVDKQGKIFTVMDAENIASQKTVEKLGLKKIGTLKHIQIFQWVLVSDFIEDDENKSDQKILLNQ
jgi:RimJ/RimL family protein N-acetyltransferase